MIGRYIQKILLVTIATLFYVGSVQAEGFAIKSNLLSDVSGTLNLGAEYSLSERTSLSVSVNYNPWEFGDNSKRKYVLIQPEYRKWLRGVYDGYFVGAQLNYGIYNIGGKLPWWIASFDTFENNRYQGDLWGLGAVSGYQWILSSRINLEASVSVGYAHIQYEKYGREVGAPMVEQGRYNYWGITQVGLTLVYYIR